MSDIKEWVGLTDEEIDDLWQMAQTWNPPKHFYLLIDAKLRQKNNCHVSLVSIQQLNLPVRVFEALHADGIKTIGQLSQMAPFEIKRIPGIGKKAYKDIKDALARFKENDI